MVRHNSLAHNFDQIKTTTNHSEYRTHYRFCTLRADGDNVQLPNICRVWRLNCLRCTATNHPTKDRNTVLALEIISPRYKHLSPAFLAEAVGRAGPQYL